MVLNFGMQENCMKASDHFREVTKMVKLGSGANRNEIRTDNQSNEEKNNF